MPRIVHVAPDGQSGQIRLEENGETIPFIQPRLGDLGFPLDGVVDCHIVEVDGGPLALSLHDGRQERRQGRVLEIDGSTGLIETPEGELLPLEQPHARRLGIVAGVRVLFTVIRVGGSPIAVALSRGQ